MNFTFLLTVFYQKPTFIKWGLSLKLVFYQNSLILKGCLPSKIVFHRRLSSIKGCHPLKVIFHRRSSCIVYPLPSKVVFHGRSSLLSPGCIWYAIDRFIPLASLSTSLEANSDRQTGGQKEKATYRGSSYRSALKYSKAEYVKCIALWAKR